MCCHVVPPVWCGVLALQNMTHQPAISVPNGIASNGLPTALQLTGKLWDDAGVLQLAHAYQGVTEHHLEVRQRNFCAIFRLKNDQCTQTGSGQT
jgi:Asp-tRNA(Asn)/Glu-tRNA(Gln) amidotransferase A subunit family amidase